MNTHQIKLELTLELLDTQDNNNILHRVGNIMKRLHQDVGNFQGLRLVKKQEVMRGLVNRIYNMVYDNCIVLLDFVVRDGKYYVNKFDVTAKIPIYA